MTDFNAMSPAELRTYANERKVDLSRIDSRKKAQLVAVLEAAERGEDPPSFDSGKSQVPEPTADPEPGSDDEIVAAAVEAVSTPVADDEERSFDRLAYGQAPPPLEPLSLDDLVFDDNKVRVVTNTFPVIVDGKDKCRLLMAKVPGEADTVAVAWWRNSTKGPVLQAGVQRVTSRHRDSDSKSVVFVTEDGTEHVYVRDDGCTTCGNRLAYWRPWPQSVRMVQGPTWD